MELQNYEKKDLLVKEKFKEFLKDKVVKKRLKFSWSNWGFGLEPLENSLQRLNKNKVQYIELHGNVYGPDLGYKPANLNKLLSFHNIKVSGVCGMVMKESEISSSSPFVRQRCIDYFKRNVELCKELDGEYILFSPGAIGRPQKYDDFEFERAVETLKILGDIFLDAGIKGAIEPVRADEVSICHTFKDAAKMIKEVNHKGVCHIAGDVYHMLHGESHIGETILTYGDYLINIHMADTNRMALGSGMLNLDIIIMSLYLIGYNNKNAFLSAEPLGPAADPYPQMNGITDPHILDKLVSDTASYFYKRESLLLEGKV
ncbi:MAG: sugar phosphate isomerase/epimerase [Actinobacteria bacterium]|nr:sugar phosphate isomerase/epimerase [Actinomycetota bacterium]